MIRVINLTKKNSHLLIIISLGIVLYLIASTKAMIFSGDTIEYLRMANQMNKGHLFPVSTAWMPLYPWMIWIISKIFLVDLLVATRIYNLILIGLIIISYNLLWVNPNLLKIRDKILMNIPLFFSSVFLKHSISIMAEMQFLLIVIVFLFSIHAFLNQESKSLKIFIFSTIMAVLGVMTKYNGFALVAILMGGIILKFGWRSWPYLITVIALVSVFYLPFLCSKPGGDFLVGGLEIREVDYFEFLLLMGNDFMKAIFSYSLPYRLEEVLLVIIDSYNIGWFFILVFVAGVVRIGKKMLNKNFSFQTVIIIFTYVYTTLMIARWLPMGVSEVNVRTWFYPLFGLSFILFIQLIKSRLKLNILLLTSIAVLGVASTLSKAKSLYTNGEGRLASPQFRKDSPLVVGMYRELRSNDLEISRIFSNEKAILSVHTDFEMVGDLPISRRFMGNTYENNLGMFQSQKRLFLRKLENKDWLIVFFLMDKNHPRFDPLLNDFILEFKNNREVAFKTTKFGYLISSNK